VAASSAPASASSGYARSDQGYRANANRVALSAPDNDGFAADWLGVDIVDESKIVSLTAGDTTIDVPIRCADHIIALATRQVIACGSASENIVARIAEEELLCKSGD
jgi:hypothetical protein